MDPLTGRTALVTGASRGLGRRIARALAGEGMAVGLAARSAEALEEVAAELRAGDARAEVLAVDLSEPGAAARLAARAQEALGGVDLLVNNAGVIGPRPFQLRPPAELERAVTVNLLAPMLLTRHLLPGMLERGRGHVVNLSSLAGKSAPPYEEAYGATKAGLLAFTQSLRREFRGTGVSASAVCPGYVTGAGMYADSVRETGARAPRRAGRTTPQAVVEAVLRAVRDDLPEILVNSVPVRPLLALAELSPRLGESLARRLRLFRSFEESARS